MRSARYLTLAIAASLAACDQPPPTQQPIHANPVLVELETLPRSASPGDTLVFVATAYNSDPVARRISGKCGPALDVAVRFPNQNLVSMAVLQLGLDPNQVCEPGADQYVPARGTLQVEYRLVVPELRGTYFAWAGARGQHSLDYTSSANRIEVR